MPKKTFKENINPAMQFISTSTEETEPDKMPSPAPTSAKTPAGYKLNPLYVETKSKRLQLLIQPSLHKKLKSKAQSEGTSVNDLINTILLETLEKE